MENLDEIIKTAIEDPANNVGNNNAYRGIFRRGFLAGYEGRLKTDCPYQDLRTYRGGITFSRSFILIGNRLRWLEIEEIDGEQSKLPNINLSTLG